MKAARTVLTLILAALCAGAGPTAAQDRSSKTPEKDAQYECEKGLVALRYGLTDEAIRYGNLAISIDPKNYGGYSLLGNVYYQKGDFAQSIAAFEKAAEIRPDLAEVHFGLGRAYFETRDLDKAEAEFKRAGAIKEDAVTSFNLARVYFMQKKLDQALGEVLNSIKKDARSAEAYKLKGIILNELGRYAEAAGTFQAGLVLAPNDVNLKINLGIAYINSQEPGKARAVLEKVLPQIDDPALKAKIEDYLKSIKDP
jgi:tetratricopeptide (TPR) repeat protein